MSELEKTVAEILVKATNAAEAAGKFAMEQLPDVAQQYIIYQGVWSGVVVLASIVALVAFALGVKRVHKYNDGLSYSTQGMPVALYWGAGIVMMIVCAISIFEHARTLVLAVFAPKILLIQWAATLVK